MIRSTRLTPVLLLIVLCSLAYLWVFESSQVPLTIYVQSEPTVYEMSQIIHQQRKEMEYISTHQEVIYRCPDDEPRIKYPRHATDELTEIVMGTNDECGNSSVTDAVLIVHTAVDHFDRRERFRKMYADYDNTKPYRLKVVFLIGSVLDAHLHIRLEIENRQYGDTVVGAFLDMYHNLTLKAVMGFRWLTNTCADVKLVIKMDDDVIFDVRKFFINYWQKTSANRKTKSIHCRLWHNAQVFRTGKWKVEKGLFANATYPFPYCSGFFVVVSPDLIKDVYLYGKSIEFFWIDDIYLYGMVPAAIGGVKFFQLGASERLISDSYGVFRKCMEKAEKCPTLAVLTNGQSEFEFEYKELISRNSLRNQTMMNSSVLVSEVKETTLNWNHTRSVVKNASSILFDASLKNQSTIQYPSAPEGA